MDLDKKRRKEWRSKYVKTLRGRALKLIGNARSRSARKNITVSLSVEWLIDKLEKNQCEITKLPFNLDAPVNESRRFDAPSLDRIDKTKHYTEDNTRLVLWSVNCALSEYGTEKMLPILKAMIKGIENDATKNGPTSVSAECTSKSQSDSELGPIHGAGVGEDCDGAHHYRGEPEGEDSCDSTQASCRICMGSGSKQLEALELYEGRADYGLTDAETESLAKLFGCVCYQR